MKRGFPANSFEDINWFWDQDYDPRCNMRKQKRVWCSYCDDKTQCAYDGMFDFFLQPGKCRYCVKQDAPPAPSIPTARDLELWHISEEVEELRESIAKPGLSEQQWQNACNRYQLLIQLLMELNKIDN